MTRWQSVLLIFLQSILVLSLPHRQIPYAELDSSPSGFPNDFHKNVVMVHADTLVTFATSADLQALPTVLATPSSVAVPTPSSPAIVAVFSEDPIGSQASSAQAILVSSSPAAATLETFPTTVAAVASSAIPVIPSVVIVQAPTLATPTTAAAVTSSAIPIIPSVVIVQPLTSATPTTTSPATVASSEIESDTSTTTTEAVTPSATPVIPSVVIVQPLTSAIPTTTSTTTLPATIASSAFETDTSTTTVAAVTPSAIPVIPSAVSVQAVTPVTSATSSSTTSVTSSSATSVTTSSTTPVTISSATSLMSSSASSVTTPSSTVATSEIEPTRSTTTIPLRSSSHTVNTAPHTSEASPETSGTDGVVFTTTTVVDLTKTITSCWTSFPSTASLPPTSSPVEVSPTPHSSIDSSTGTSDPPSSTLTSLTVITSTSTRTTLVSDSGTTSTLTETITLTQTKTREIVSVTTEAPSTTPTFSSPPQATVTLTQGSTVDPSTITVTLATTLTTSELQTVTVVETPQISTSFQTSLATAGNPTVQPFNTTLLPMPTSKISPLTTGSAVIHTSSLVASSTPAGDIFSAVNAGGPPPAQISTRGDHPVPTLGIKKTGPIETNKFYANFFLGTRTAPSFTFPYAVAWAAGQGVSGSWGLGISQVTRAQTVYGPGDPAPFYINPGGLESVVISARELGSSTSLSVVDPAGFSVNIQLAPSATAATVLAFPLVQGMGMVTGVYSNGTPLLQSTIFFSTLTYGGLFEGENTARYTVTLMDKTSWFIYMTADSGSTLPTLTLASDAQIVGNRAFSGTLQVAKVPSLVAMGAVEALYDQTAGVYPVAGSITASANGTSGSYTFSWYKAGITSKKLLMWALPHHMSSLSSTTAGAVQNGFLMQTTTKGLATAILADSWTLKEQLPTDIGFAPWSPTFGSVTQLPATVKALINSVAATELAENMEAQTDLNSMYFAGKGLAKFASIVYTANNIGGSTGTASAGLVNLKAQFARFVSNTQIYPLVYDSVWGGAVSSSSYITGNSGDDFGNTYYNDHHFHYGYFVYTAAVIGYLDPTWLSQGTNKAWVNMLIRDYANPVSNDGYFPFSRMFDWYHGHSWAAGLFESFDGKNQESSSEDAFASYALKMWGRTTGDANMEARGNLMLAVQARALNDYYLMQSSNTIAPAEFVPNKAAGILFENKVDHTTYFGLNIEYIEGIHMLPLNPSSALTRNMTFVSQEWETYFSNGRVDTVAGGWRGILYANLALFDPITAYAFFADPNFNMEYLDGGASRTWYLAYCAGLGGAPS